MRTCHPLNLLNILYAYKHPCVSLCFIRKRQILSREGHVLMYVSVSFSKDHLIIYLSLCEHTPLQGFVTKQQGFFSTQTLLVWHCHIHCPIICGKGKTSVVFPRCLAFITNYKRALRLFLLSIFQDWAHTTNCPNLNMAVHMKRIK